jgi:putative transposase
MENPAHICVEINSLNLVSESLPFGRRFRTLNVIVDISRGSLAAVVDRSLSGIRVAREQDRIAAGSS